MSCEANESNGVEMGKEGGEREYLWAQGCTQDKAELVARGQRWRKRMPWLACSFNGVWHNEPVYILEGVRRLFL